MSFQHLRQTPWTPAFTWVDSIAKAADQINSFHEDYPKRVRATEDVIERLERFPGVPSTILKLIHLCVFANTSYRGRWRNLNVQIGLHRPPSYELVPQMMKELQTYQIGLDYDALDSWYTDFETIHPFQDGNGRVGGIIVAVYSHTIHPERGWLAVEQ